VGEGINPFWAFDGKSIYFVTSPGSATFSNVNITLVPSFVLGQQTTVPRPTTFGGGPGLPRGYDVAPDNQQFVAIVGTIDLTDAQIKVVINCNEELKRLVPAKP
jgi:hypothetical protein